MISARVSRPSRSVSGLICLLLVALLAGCCAPSARRETPTVEQPTKVPTAVEPTKVPTVEEPTKVPTAEQPTEVPTVVEPTTIPSPTPMVLPYEVRRKDLRAWATLATLDVFDELPNAWKGLMDHGVVATDPQGQAEICPSDSFVPGTQECKNTACHVWVYGNSAGGVDSYCCPREAAGKGSSWCFCAGHGSFHHCSFQVTTPSADVQGQGTWFEVTYEWQTQTTTVIIGEGQVTVTPVLTLELRSPQSPPGDIRNLAAWWKDFAIVKRTLGEPVRSPIIPAGDSPKQFLYTAPTIKLEALKKEVAYLPMEKAWQPLETLPRLMLPLLKIDPQLSTSLDKVWSQATADNVNLGLLADAVRTGEWLYVRMVWVDEKVADAVVRAVDWEAITKEALGLSLPVVVNLSEGTREGRQIINDARTLGYDPEALKRIGFARPVALAVSPELPRDGKLYKSVETVALQIQRQLDRLKVKTTLIELELAKEQPKIDAYVDEGFVVIVLSMVRQ